MIQALSIKVYKITLPKALQNMKQAKVKIMTKHFSDSISCKAQKLHCAENLHFLTKCFKFFRMLQFCFNNANIYCLLYTKMSRSYSFVKACEFVPKIQGNICRPMSLMEKLSCLKIANENLYKIYYLQTMNRDMSRRGLSFQG